MKHTTNGVACTPWMLLDEKILSVCGLFTLSDVEKKTHRLVSSSSSGAIETIATAKQRERERERERVARVLLQEAHTQKKKYTQGTTSP